MNPTTRPAEPTSPSPSSSSPPPDSVPHANGTVVTSARKAPRPVAHRGRWARLWQIGGAVVVLALLVWGAQRWLFGGARATDAITAVVQRTDLPIIVTERGKLESAATVKAKCQVEGKNCKIVFLAPEGEHVKKGDVVVRFDADEIRRGMAEQEIKFKTADGKAKAAREELDVAKNKSDSEIAKAELALALAKLDKRKYLEGEYKVEVDDKKGAISLAERELKEAEEKLDGFRTFVRKGFGTPEQLTLKELDVLKAKANLDRDKAKLMVLEEFTLVRQQVELEFKEKDAARELDRQKGTARATIAKAQNDLDTAQAVLDLEQQQFDRAREQLKHVEIAAPRDGIVIYELSRPWDPSTRVQLGGLMNYQQPVFQLPDLEHMQVNVKIHESKIKKVRAGQKCEVRIEAFPGLVLHGTVKRVAPLPDPEGNWLQGGGKEFETILAIDDLPTGAGLKPGFTAEVSIQVNHLPGVLAVPVQAVVQREDQHYAYVSTSSGIVRREVIVGENNEKFTEVRTGLSEGEAVVLDARIRANAEFQAGTVKGSKTRDTEAKSKAPGTNP